MERCNESLNSQTYLLDHAASKFQYDLYRLSCIHHVVARKLVVRLQVAWV